MFPICIFSQVLVFTIPPKQIEQTHMGQIYLEGYYFKYGFFVTWWTYCGQVCEAREILALRESHIQSRNGVLGPL